MTGKNNGSGNGTDNNSKVVKLPTLAERDRMRKEKERAEKATQQAAKASNKKVPFFNAGKIPPFTRAMVFILVVVHLAFFAFTDPAGQLKGYYMFGFVPGYFTGTVSGAPWYAPAGVAAHIFIHGGWFHLLMNTTMMLAMGMFFETAFGARRTAIFFFLSALGGALLFFAFNLNSTSVLIGASGGINGLFAATLLILYQRGQLGGFNKRGPLPLILFWLALLVFSGMLSGSNMAWQAHVGGFLTGAGLLWLMQKRKVRF